MAVPVRTCVSCGRKAPKRELTRFTWQDAAPAVDSIGNKAGRGAYCCKSEKCLKMFEKQHKKWKRIFRL